MKFELELLFLHVWLVVGFADGHQLLWSCSSALESLDHALSPDRIITTEHGLVPFHPSDDGLNDVTPESLIEKCLTSSQRENRKQGCRRWLASWICSLSECKGLSFAPSRPRTSGHRFPGLRVPWWCCPAFWTLSGNHWLWWAFVFRTSYRMRCRHSPFRPSPPRFRHCTRELTYDDLKIF